MVVTEKISYFFQKYKKGILTSVGVGIILTVFGGVAFKDLGKFETSDEDLWKEGRIQQYWDGMKNGIVNGDWRNTYINDKPGVTVAILSGLMLDHIPDPKKQIKLTKEAGKYLFQTHKSYNTEAINRGLRIPIVLFTIISLGLIGFLIYRWTESGIITIGGMLFIALNPVLLGISQIINPDSILWSSVSIALISFLVALKTMRWRYVILAGVFFGIAILSKYTGNLVTLFFLGLIALSAFFTMNLAGQYFQILRRKILFFLVSTGIGYGIFILFLPHAVEVPKLFLYGTFLAPGMKESIVPVVILLGFFIIDSLFFQARMSLFFSRWLRKGKSFFLRIVAGTLFLLFAGHLINVGTGAVFVPLNDMRERIEYQTGSKGSAHIDLVFPMINREDSTIIEFSKKILVESSYTFFNLPSAVIVILMVGMVFVLVRGKVQFYVYTVFALTVPWVFFVGGLMADVLVNVRYGIILQPILSLLAGIFILELGTLIKERYRVIVVGGVMVLIAVLQIVALRSITPHYLNYQNVFLPQSMSFADSWSYGEYEAAQWLNKQPNAKYLQVWTDRKAFCRFFVGKCIRNSSIDLSLVSPDYFVITRRNVMKGSVFTWKKPELAVHPSEYYYSDDVVNNPEWELLIGGRPLNYVKVIRSEEGGDVSDFLEWKISPLHPMQAEEQDDFDEGVADQGEGREGTSTEE